jgi:DNA invertase Pin-like site-specific DNA recombinase
MAETPEQLIHRLEPLHAHTVYGYVRVSSDSQEDNQSLSMQQADIEKYCKEKALDHPHCVAEVASAAKPMWVVNLPGAPAEDKSTSAAPRPMLMTLLTHMKQVREKVGTKQLHLIVWKLDRLARVDYEQELFLTLFRRDNIQLHSVVPTEDHMLDGGHVRDPARAFTRTVLAAAASYERALIEMRMSSGMAYKAANGGYTGGVPPFGYAAKNAELVIVPHEARMVCFVFHLKIRYKLSASAISRYITQNKDPADKESYDRFKIIRILNNKSLYSGMYRDRYGVLHLRQDLKILPDDPEALLDYVERTSQPKRETGQRLPDPRDHTTPQRTGDDLGPGGSAGDERSQEIGEAGLPADPQGDVSTSGNGEPGTDQPAA